MSRNVVVTGGNRGIGRAIAMRFLRDGDTVAIIGRDQEALDNTKEAAGDAKGRLHAFRADLAKPVFVESVFADIERAIGPVEVLINNAGINTRNDYRETTLDAWNEEIAINLTGAFVSTQCVIKGMVQRRAGHVIMVSSVKGLEGSRSLSYGASKAGLISLTRSYARAVSADGVRVNCVVPSMVETEMANLWSPSDREKYLKSLPVGRFAQPEEVADLAWFLCSAQSNFMSGAIVHVDGGYFL